MGFTVESYDLSELHRIAVPGKVVPSLFWVMPVGDWQPGQLTKYWYMFTDGTSVCSDMGLLLVKAHGPGNRAGSDVNLDSIGARLKDVIPVGAERFVHPGLPRESAQGLLVLSGAYPQPGWGLFIADVRNAPWFDSLVTRSRDALTKTEQCRAQVDEFKQMSMNVARLHELEGGSDTNGETIRERRFGEGYRRAVERVYQAQWSLGPQFLVALEDTCRQEHVNAQSIPWDPARMVGWKILARNVGLQVLDLHHVAKEIAPDVVSANAELCKPSGLADGSFFTDYVHHIASSKPDASPWTVTRDLVARLLRPAEMIRLLESHGCVDPPSADSNALAESLLDCMGWMAPDIVREKPLAGCISHEGNDQPSLAADISGNELRIVLESFCKDVLDVMVAKLGYSHRDVWSVIENKVPQYEPLSRTRDWGEEIGRMTVGAAVLLLPVLGKLAFPGKGEDVSALAAHLGKLSGKLNRSSHHHESGSCAKQDPEEVPALVCEILSKARLVLGELPWHMEVSTVYGKQPRVLSGEAWSHGSPAPRLLRVMHWTGVQLERGTLIWNMTLGNPIIADPVFVKRPHASGDNPD